MRHPRSGLNRGGEEASAQPVDTYAGGTVGLEANTEAINQSRRLAVGRCVPKAVSRRSVQSLVVGMLGRGVFELSAKAVLETKNPQPAKTPAENCDLTKLQARKCSVVGSAFRSISWIVAI